MPSGSILIVEDRASLRRMMERALLDEGYSVTVAGDAEDGLRCLEESPFDLLLTDLKLPGASGLELLTRATERRPGLPVVMITAYGTVAGAVAAMKAGAVDFLEKPVELEALFELAARWVGGVEEQDLFEAPGGTVIVGSHPRIRSALRLLERVAPAETTVLLTGESGTGKELFARALHELSSRHRGPFVAVNCAALPDSLVENELFGHERGAFTGAHRRQAGRFEAAAGGTLLLDEVGDLGLGTQAKILRVLEERRFQPVGGAKTVDADVRLVAATNRDLGAMVEEGDFREDLFFRLEVVPIELPALRDRASDVPKLASHLIERIASRSGRPPISLAASAREWLEAQPWPGNVRQLANTLERALLLTDGPQIEGRDLEVLAGAWSAGEERQGEERQRVRQALRDAGGDKRRAAELLGVSYGTLQRRIRRYDLEGFPRYRS